ncbi:MAG: prepilin-type N-terminal cleavage/methylation domain-containing protein [Archangium sp.]|nr:prepilin-type N-terminal cleavage/methylation domain-containing protein [Archangium sp.]
MRTVESRRRGFSLLEVMIALGIMLVGAVGAITGIIAANKSLFEGQRLLYKSVLIDNTLSRVRLQNKEQLYTAATATTATTMPPLEAIGTGHWTMDPSVVVAGDLSTGALFFVGGNGMLMRCTSGSTPACPTSITTCADANIPQGVFCREVAATRSAASFTPGGIVPAGTFVTTQWVRVIEKKAQAAQTTDSALVGREVFAQ